MCDFDRIESLRNGTLPQEECAAVRRHLETCPNCRRWYDMLEALDTEVAAPDDLAEHVMAQVRTTRQMPRKTTRRWLPMAAAAACLLLVAGLGLYGQRPSTALPSPAVMSRGIEEDPAAEAMSGTYRYTAPDGSAVTGTLTEEQTASVRTWLAQQTRTEDARDGAGTPQYLLTAAEVEALLKAVPGLNLRVTETWFSLPGETK